MITQIIIWIFWLSVQSFCWKMNLALNKKAYLSSIFHEMKARFAVDGNKHGNSYAHANENDGWFVVDLGRPYQVEYIVFYQRSYCPDCQDRMDNFIVGLSNNFDPQINKTLNRDYKRCGQYNGSVPPGARVELQCKDKEAYSRYVIIQQDVGKKYLTIPELEVMGEYINYVGCFETLVKKKSIGSNVNLKECIKRCEILNFIYAAFQKTGCICGNETQHYSPLSECNVLCPGGVDYCGSSDKLSVYEVFPLKFVKDIKRKYIGCFVDNNDNRDLMSGITDNNSMTLDKCQINCAQQNYLFFGVQYKYDCFCGNNYGMHGKGDENSCDMTCKGSPSQICGGTSRNSIYSIYPEKGGSYFFKNNHHCKGDLNLDGICGNKQCEDGWTGEDCTLRKCSINNGDCGVHKCLNNNGTLGVFSECICREGFDKSFWWDYCHDINECEDETHECNTTVSTCFNKEGYYECKCLSGLQMFDVIKCKDIDECENYECNKTTMNCHNIFRSYICECKEGFKDDNLKNCRDRNECEEIPDVCNLTISNCTNTFGSHECQCLEEGYVYDIKTSTCFQRYDNPGTRIFVFTVVIILCVLGVISLIKYRNKFIARVTCERKLNRTEQIKKANDVQVMGAVSLFELKDYYLRNKSRLLTDFEKFPQVTESPTSYGQNTNLWQKNKCRKIIPFDHNRVVLKTLPNEELSDYINASFIPSFQGTFQFIAAQGPMKETEYDFWRMIFEYKVEIIVMLTNCMEDRKINCLQYWPNNSKYISDINITLKDLKCWSTHDIRKFVVTKGNITHEVTHTLYKLWMKNKAPENIGSLLNIHHIMDSLKKQNSASPILIHCSNGVGRTGTFLAMDHLLHEAQQTGMVDVFKCLKFLRSHRNYMIQTKNQFQACFKVLSFYHDWGDTTAIQLSNGVNIQHLFLKRKCFIEKEYEWISQNTSSDKQDLRCRNNKKQLIFPGCVQNSTYKIHIESEISWQSVGECCAGEDNAVTILVDELVEEKLNELPLISASGNLNLTKRFSHLNIEHIEMVTTASDRHVYVNIDKVNIFAISYISCEHLRHLWSAIKEFQKKEKTLLIQSRDINKAGFVVCALNLLEMMDAVEEIDVFQVVYQLKSLIPHFMENIDQYRNLNLLVENYLTCNE